MLFFYKLKDIDWRIRGTQTQILKRNRFTREKPKQFYKVEILTKALNTTKRKLTILYPNPPKMATNQILIRNHNRPRQHQNEVTITSKQWQILI